MGNKMKKLICALLASAMLVSSVGMVAFADEVETTATETTATETVVEATEAPAEEATEATEAPAEEAVATEAPVATQAPVVTGTAYDNDAYYQKALSLCSALGIISGYEDGSVKPESKVTRAEMASIVLRMLNTKSMSVYQNGFKDVTSAHWAADQIQTAQEASIINGMGDGTFAPDGEVTYAQVMVMLVNALNYKQDAAYYGGWQAGYVKMAGELDLLKNAPGSNDVASERGVVIKMVYNALLADYKDIVKYENGTPVYEAKETLSEAKFDLVEQKGVLMGTAKTSVSGVDIQDGHIEILPDEESKAVLYACELTGLEDYIAQTITYYYKENSGLTPEVLAVTYDASKTDVVETDVEDIETLSGFNDNAGVIKLEGVAKKKDCTDATIIYNGKVVTEAQMAENDMDDLLLPEVGSLKLVDSDDDDVYDIVFVDSYETVIVSSASAERLTAVASAATEDEIGATQPYSLNLDDSEDRVVTVKREGMDVKLRNLKKNDVASIKRSLDNTVVDIVVTGKNMTGKATGVSTRLDATRITVDGEKYDVANIAVDDIKTGVEAIFYFDQFDRIAYIEAASADGMLQSGEKYGWIIDCYESEDGNDYVVNMFTTDGKAVEMELGSKLELWAPGATEATNLSSTAEVAETLDSIIDNSTSANKDKCLKSGTSIIRLVKYKANSAGVISRLYFAVNSTIVDDEDALRINPNNLKGIPSMGGAVSGYSIQDGILEISVPSSVADLRDASNYKIGEVTSSAYVVRENGSTKSFVVGEFESKTTPTLLINFTASATAAAVMTDMDSAGSGPAVMVIEDINQGIDEDENAIYTIDGYIGGTEVSITTNKNTNVGVLTSALWTGSNNGRNFDAPTVWDGTGAYDDVDLTDYLKKGDLIFYTTDGRLIAKYADAEALGANVLNGTAYTLPFGNTPNKSSSRVSFYFNALEEFDLGDSAWVKIKGFDNTVIFDPSKLMDVVTINSKGMVDIDLDGATVSDLITYDAETKTGDFLFISTANKGDLANMVVFRFE